MKNLGPKSRAWLEEVGIDTEEKLRELGAVTVYRMVKQAGFPATLNLLYALEGAIAGTDWRDVTPKRKSELQEELAQDD